MPVITVKRKERSNRMSAHVINRSRVTRSVKDHKYRAKPFTQNVFCVDKHATQAVE